MSNYLQKYTGVIDRHVLANAMGNYNNFNDKVSRLMAILAMLRTISCRRYVRYDRLGWVLCGLLSYVNMWFYFLSNLVCWSLRAILLAFCFLSTICAPLIQWLDFSPWLRRRITLFLRYFFKIPMNMFMEIGAQEGGFQAVKQGRRWRGEKSMVAGALNSTTKS